MASNPNTPFASAEEMALNQAILSSLYPTTNVNPGLLPQPPTYGYGTQVPVQTTMTRVPIQPVRLTQQVPIVPQPRPVTQMPTIPQPRQVTQMSTIPQPRQVTQMSTIPQLPIIPRQKYPPTTTLPPIPKPNIPIIPPLAMTTTTARVTPIPSPRTTFPPIQPVQLSPRRITSPRSPARMTPEEEEQMRIAIMASLEETRKSPITQTIKPLPSPPRTEEEDIEDILLQEAIQASITAAEQARIATFHANQVAVTPSSPRALSPRNLEALERSELREEQEREYQEALRIDREREENARKAAEAAALAAAAAEEAARKLQEAKIAENTKKEALQPPILKYPIDTVDIKDIFMIRFRLPTGSLVTHSFHRDEPLSSIIKQLQFDLRHPGDLTVTIPGYGVITCAPETSISTCGFNNRIAVMVDYA